MSRKKNPVLSEHFERLKELLPDVYTKQYTIRESKNEKLFRMLKSALGIVEAVYLQNREMFSPVRVEEYGKIIHQLKELGFDYHGNEELLEKAAGQLIMQSKLPMKKAGASQQDSKKKAI